MIKLFFDLCSGEIVVMESDFWEPSDFYFASQDHYFYIGDL